MLSAISKSKIIDILDKIILSCLILYAFTFLLDINIKFLTTAFIFGIIKLFFIRPQIKIYSKHFYFIAFFILCTFLSVIFNDISSNLSSYKSRFISPLIGILIIFLYQFTKKQIIIILSSFSISLLLNALIIIYQFLQGETGRLIGFASNYMLLCGINLLILPVIYTIAISKSNISNKLRILYLSTILINIPAIIFENTRIVWLGLFITFSIISIVSIRNKLKSLFIIILILLSSSLIFQFSPESYQRFQSITDTTQSTQSNYQRILMWNASIKMFIDYPIFGIGIGNYHDKQASSYLTEEFIDIPYHPHNTFLYILSESGLLGAISYISLFLYLFYNAINNFKSTKNIISLSYIACLIAYNINCLTDTMFCGYNIKTTTYIFWLFTGMYLILNKQIITNYNNKDN